MKEEVAYENTISQSCPRRKCFAGRHTRTHENRSDGSAATGFGGIQNNPDLPIVRRLTFYECTTRIYTGCPLRFRR